MFDFREEECGICRNPSKRRLSSLKLRTGELVCQDCRSYIDQGIDINKFKRLPLENARSYINYRKNNLQLLKSFNQDKIIETSSIKLLIDFNKKKFYLQETGFFQANKNSQIYNFKDILNYNIIKDDETVNKGGLSRAIVGGILAGGIGALVGASLSSQENYIKNLGVNISIDNPYKSNLFIPIINHKVKQDSLVYRQGLNTLNSIISALDYMIEHGRGEDTNREVSSSLVADEIIKLKSLMDQGIITEEQFIRKKDKLMGD